MHKLKSIYFLIFCGFVISLIYANFNLNNFDKLISNKTHYMIKGDLNLIWDEAEVFKNDISNNKNFLEAGKIYTRTYLHSKYIAALSIIFNKDLFENHKRKIIKPENNFIFLFTQISIFYLSVIFFYKKLSVFISDEKTVYFTILFLSLEPTILQWHPSFWTESIYFSLMILTLSLIISDKKTFINFGLIGFMLGVLYLQKSVSILLIAPLIIYFFFTKIEKKFFKINVLVFSYLFILVGLGYSNFLKTGSFYVLSPQTKDSAQYHYLLPRIFEEKQKVNNNIDLEKIELIESKWKQENSYNGNNFKDRLKLGKFKQSKSIEVMLENKFITAKLYLMGIARHALLNPFQNYYWYVYNSETHDIEFHLSEDKKKILKYRIAYSLIIFFIVSCGVFKIFKEKKNILFYLLIFSLIVYYSLMLGWISYTRYFMPSLILISIIFGNGMSLILNLLQKKD